jgi:hypothetical protein
VLVVLYMITSFALKVLLGVGEGDAEGLGVEVVDVVDTLVVVVVEVAADVDVVVVVVAEEVTTGVVELEPEVVPPLQPPNNDRIKIVSTREIPTNDNLLSFLVVKDIVFSSIFLSA